MRPYSFRAHAIPMLIAIAAGACGFPTVDIAEEAPTTSSGAGTGAVFSIPER